MQTEIRLSTQSGSFQLGKADFQELLIQWTPEAIRWSEGLGCICGHRRPRLYSLWYLAGLVDLKFVATEIQGKL